jgi:hypothetical protein
MQLSYVFHHDLFLQRRKVIDHHIHTTKQAIFYSYTCHDSTFTQSFYITTNLLVILQKAH